MSFDPFTAAFDLGKIAIEKIWPDANKRAEELRKLEELKQAGDLAQLNAHVQLMLGQISINLKEAEHKSLFVAGWRPFVGWVGGIGLAWAVIVYPLVSWIWAWARPTYTDAAGLVILVPMPPSLGVGVLMPVLLGMLGVGTMRSFDKKGGNATQSLGKQ
jgi:hypothetical protein